MPQMATLMSAPETDPGSGQTLQRLLTLHPKLVDLSLGRMHRILAALGHPEQRVPPAVHVTGTNGKGSVLAFMRAILEAAGLRVHVYTSPHLVHFHERIRLAGEVIAEDHLQAILDECERANAGEEITFFEITTAAAFVAFARTPADVLLLENGLGGRLDATNVIARPALTAITPVSMDHQQFLGNTLAEIATEKAGIIKPHVRCIVGPQHPDAMDVIAAHADAKEAPLSMFGVNWRAHATEDGMEVEQGDEVLVLPTPALPGAHQIINAGHAVVAARSLPNLIITQAHIAKGLLSVDWPGRLQRLRRGPVIDLVTDTWEVWLDGGHNPDAAQAINAYAQSHWSDQPLYLICGMIESKDPAGYFGALENIASVQCITIPDEKAAIGADDLVGYAEAAGLKAVAAETLEAAVHAIFDTAAGSTPARILICGSLYFAGHVLKRHG